MGVPKFFRYMSERYPCLSEVIKEYQIPEFDTLYLDMNGIIHNCSHPNDNDPHFRITEKQIFQDIFHYIEVLFRMIQPKQLFFMAIDGVAPRAKMNQQRGRRFRSAKEMETLEQKARERGETLPSEKRFDSNCITPGTPFMCRLHQQLRYFVKLKMSTDKLWRNVKIILSGHETPGEGEHKIMDYIRFMKSKPDYNPNLRHCLYGLDADLIMLGLCTHEPFFSLLREEVKFNTKSNKGGTQILTPEETKFFLLHLSLMRDYLELEFSKLKEPGVLSFAFDIEKIVDDWVLMGFLIGNDFIPNLPDLHIIDGALPLMYKVYQETLPTLDGYINEAGYLNLKRFEKFMQKMASFDFEHFREKYADIQYLEGKTGKKFSDVFHNKQKNMDPALAALIKATDDDFDFDDGTEEVLNYVDYDEYYYSDEDEEWRSNFFSEFGQHKTDYYKYKLDYEKVTNEVLRDQAECYIRAIQWNLHYYYNGCVSWSWYYPHHYAPYISDIKDFANMKIDYEMGKPFLPFQQLLAVLPAASKELLPRPYQDLMTLEQSSIFEYYPTEFQTDLNGKKQDWEAVVLIPFIDEKRLIEAMSSVEHLLTEEEKYRNRHGPMLVYSHTYQNLGVVEAPEHFHSIQENHAIERAMWRDEIFVHPHKLVKGLCKNVNMSLHRTRFPTLKHFVFSHKLEMAKVKVFQQPSRGESMILTLEPPSTQNLKHIADQILGKTIFLNYPHLVEVKVLAVSSKNARISLDKSVGGPVYEQSNKEISERFLLSKKTVTDEFFYRLGINIGNTEVLVFGQPVESRKYFFGPRGKVTQQRTYIRSSIVYAFQTAVLNLQPPRDVLEFKSIDDIFYPGCQCFTLSNPYYGSEGTVIDTVKEENSFIKLSLKVQPEPDLRELVRMKDTTHFSYMPSYTAASKLSITPLLLSRFTGSIFILDRPEDEGGRRQNIGLNIKFSRRNEEVVGFTRRDEQSKKWYYTDRVVQLIRDYMQKFPEVFGFLRDHSSDDIYLRSEVFPNNGEERVRQIVTWLKEQPHSKAEVRPCGANIVDDKIVDLIERTVDACDKSEKRMTLLVKPNKLYIPKSTLDKVCVDLDTQFELFDRIVNIRDSYTVPLGYRGTVIGITHGETSFDTMCDVVFDKPFPHGVKIRCSESRGYRMPVQAMINLTHGERLNGGSNHFVRNLVKSRDKNSMSYSNVAKRPTKDQMYNNKVYKENSPPVQPSPHHASVSGVLAKVPTAQQPLFHSQQSRHTQSPANNLISQQSSPNMNNSQNSKSPLQVNYNNNTQAQSNTTKKGESSKPIINKEQRRIFSIPTFPTPVSLGSELSGGRSFFGHPNILDVPENKNKFFTGEFVNATKESTKSPEQSVSSPISSNETTPVLDKPELRPSHNVDKDISIHQEGGSSKSCGNSINFIPSISKLVQENNFTAKTDFQTASSPFKDFLYGKTSSSQLSTTPPTSDTSLSAAFSSLFNKSNINCNLNEAPPSVSGDSDKLGSSNKQSGNESNLAVDSQAFFGTILPTNKSSALNQRDFFSFHEKHGLEKSKIDHNVPTITTEIRKISKSNSQRELESDDEDEEEEEEVMIIEFKEDGKLVNADVETTNNTSGKSTAKPDVSVNNVQEFFANLNINTALFRPTTLLEHIPSLDKVETNSNSVANITADTINDFFLQAEEMKKKEQVKKLEGDNGSSGQENVLNKMVSGGETGKSNVDMSQSKANGTSSDILKKMLNIDCAPPLSGGSIATTSAVDTSFKTALSIAGSQIADDNSTKLPEEQQQQSRHTDPVFNIQQQTTSSAFKLVKPLLTTQMSTQSNKTTNLQSLSSSGMDQVVPSSGVQINSSALQASATVFIPSQVQKRIVKPVATQQKSVLKPNVSESQHQFFAHPQSQFLFQTQQHQQQQQVPKRGNDQCANSNSFMCPKPTFTTPLKPSMSNAPSNKPILGNQVNVYPPQPQQPLYYQNQSNHLFYSGMPLQQMTYLPGVQATPQYVQPPLGQVNRMGQQFMRHNNAVSLPPNTQMYTSNAQMMSQPTGGLPQVWPSSYQQPNTPSSFQPYQLSAGAQQFLPSTSQPVAPRYGQPPMLQQNYSTTSTLHLPTRYEPLSTPQPITAPIPSASNILVEQETDSYLLRLLKLTRHYKLGTPDYTFERDNGFVTTVRISHPHSDIVIKGKRCASKGDSIESCARIAYHELIQVYPPPVPRQKSDDKPDRILKPVPTQTNENVSAPTSLNESNANAENCKPDVKKTKKPRMAANFNVPFQSKK